MIELLQMRYFFTLLLLAFWALPSIAKVNHDASNYNIKKNTHLNFSKSLEFYVESDTQELLNSQHNIVSMYANGHGVAKDYKKAFEWFNKAANKGLALSQQNLGSMYVNGDGVDKDLAKAFEWSSKAAHQGLATSQQNVGLMYANGYGVDKDLNQAFNWLNKAATLGNAEAMAHLASWHHDGLIGSRNLVLAHFWFDLAGKYALNGAHKYRDKVALLLPQIHIEKAKKVANNWIIGQEIPHSLYEH